MTKFGNLAAIDVTIYRPWCLTFSCVYAAQQSVATPSSQEGKPSQLYDPWAGQHVPSQGFSPHLAALGQSFGTANVATSSDPQQQYFAAPATDSATTAAAATAASPFPATMSTPFAQAGYPATSDPWAAHPSHSFVPDQTYADPSATSSSHQQNPWAASSAYPVPNPWDPMAAAANPWDASGGQESPAAVLGGDNGGLDSGYRSCDGRPAVSLFVFGFAGKMYCWRPTASPGMIGLSPPFPMFCLCLVLVLQGIRPWS